MGRPCPERRGVFPRAGTRRLLDFGCGSGGYLKRMAALGWRDGLVLGLWRIEAKIK